MSDCVHCGHDGVHHRNGCMAGVFDNAGALVSCNCVNFISERMQLDAATKRIAELETAVAFYSNTDTARAIAAGVADAQAGRIRSLDCVDGGCERDRLKSQLAEQSATIAGLRNILLRYVCWMGAAHVQDCPADDTCSCHGKEINDAVNAALHDPALAGRELLAELEKGRADTARLDWREAHPKHGFGLYFDEEWADGYGGSHKTYRDAVDAAMKFNL